MSIRVLVVGLGMMSRSLELAALACSRLSIELRPLDQIPPHALELLAPSDVARPSIEEQFDAIALALSACDYQPDQLATEVEEASYPDATADSSPPVSRRVHDRSRYAAWWWPGGMSAGEIPAWTSDVHLLKV